MSGPTRHLLRYLKHLAAKGGEHARLADDANSMIRIETFLGMGKGLGIDPRRLDAIAGPEYAAWIKAPTSGVSEKQKGHLLDLMRGKFKDVDDYGKWAEMGTPSGKELQGMRQALDDNWAEKFAKYKTMKGSDPKLWAELTETPGKINRVRDLETWLAKRGKE